MKLTFGTQRAQLTLTEDGGDVTADAIYRDIGSKVRQARSEKGTTQGELASRANLTRTSISNIEAGRQRVTLYALLRMAEALDVAPATLLPDLRSLPSADVNMLIERGASPDEASALARLLRV